MSEEEVNPEQDGTSPETSPEQDNTVEASISEPIEKPFEEFSEASEPEALTSEQTMSALNADTYKGSELMDVLAQLEALVAAARSLPMSASVLVNKAQAMSLLDSARNAMPADIRIANQIVAGANAVVERAQEEASQLLSKANAVAQRIEDDAHARADELTNQERIVVMAKERGEQIIEAATRKAQELTSGADKYCEDKLRELEKLLTQLQEQSAAGRKVLAERAAASRDETPSDDVAKDD